MSRAVRRGSPCYWSATSSDTLVSSSALAPTKKSGRSTWTILDYLGVLAEPQLTYRDVQTGHPGSPAWSN